MKISLRDNVTADIVRPDLSKSQLEGLKSDGYEQVFFKANVVADPDCEVLDGYVYNIDELLQYDNPLFRTSHPNCRCEFVGLESSKSVV